MTRTLLTNGEGGVGVPTAIAALKAGETALKALEAGIRLVEDDPRVTVVGYGGAPNLLGEVECDASVMDGSTLAIGSVGALKGYKHAISVAHEVLKRLPHVLLVAEGAARFAAEIHAEKGEMLTDESRDKWQKWLQKHVPENVLANWPNVPLAQWAQQAAKSESVGDTTVYLAQDHLGRIAGGASSSGLPYKYPGRLGDSPVIGAGLYADNRYGAATCTHTGEMTIRSCTAHSVVLYMKKGASVQDACHEALDDLRSLKGGDIATVVIHAIDVQGEHYVVSTASDKDTEYWFWSEEMSQPERYKAVIEPL
jgi:L-asparaginase